MFGLDIKSRILGWWNLTVLPRLRQIVSTR